MEVIKTICKMCTTYCGLDVYVDNGKIVEVDIDALRGYYETAKNFVSYVKRIIEGEEEF